MASKSRYIKLAVGDSAPLSRRTSVMGAKVVGEWNEDGKRWLMFERTMELRAKPTGKRKATASKQITEAKAKELYPATAFPGSDVANG